MSRNLLLCGGVLRSALQFYRVESRVPLLASFNVPHFSSSSPTAPKPEESGKKNKEKEEYITMMGPGELMSVLPLTDAHKLASRRDLKLIKVKDFDAKRQTAVYKLISNSDYLKEDIDARKNKQEKSGFKGEKILNFSSKISEHDLKSKINQIHKWLEKNYEIRVTISGTEAGDVNAENAAKIIETSIGTHGRILQKRAKGTDVKFQVAPPKKS